MIVDNKCIYYIFTALLFSLAIVQMGMAQDQKIGYVNTDEILNQLPEYQGIDQRLELITQQWRTEIDEMEQRIEELKKEFEAKEILFTEEVRKQRQQEIDQLVTQKEAFVKSKFGPDGDYFKRQKELLEPIQRVVFDAISTVAEDNGFDFVFDRAGDVSVMYSRQEWNLNDEVLLELGIDIQNSRN